MTDLRRDRRESQRGFALLLIFALAAAVAISLYRELPRAVFESARAKEELLVERGEQYQLAIRRFVAKTKGKYPQSLDELENTGGVRFLRRRYKDPMTGEDEWRLIHIGPGGFTDSKVFKPQQQEKKEAAQSSITQGYSVGQSQLESDKKGMQEIAMRQREGDKGPPPMGEEGRGPDDPSAEQNPDGSPADAPNDDPNAPGAPGSQPPGQLRPGQILPGQAPQQDGPVPGGGQPGQGGATGGSFGGFGGGSFGGQAAPAGNPQAAQGGVPGQPPGTQGPSAGNNPALNMIQQRLTTASATGPTPSAAGSPGQTSMQGAGQTVVGGIAGVASKYEGKGIKLIHERSRIDEWEFLFDASKQPGAAGKPQIPGQPREQPGGQPGGQPAPQGLQSTQFSGSRPTQSGGSRAGGFQAGGNTGQSGNAQSGGTSNTGSGNSFGSGGGNSFGSSTSNTPPPPPKPTTQPQPRQRR